jgi:muramoyltetrapeptide carboxypeptidase LdcA involved in peptidoglycan recycling
MFEHYAALVEGPVLANVQYGHIPRKLTIPFGLKARVDGSAGTIDLLEAVVD